MSELVEYIENYRNTNTIFKMPDLCHLLTSRYISLGVNNTVHTSRLREELLLTIPDLVELQTCTIKVYNNTDLAFDADVSKALFDMAENNCSSETLLLSKAARILRNHMFTISNNFNGTFTPTCQEKSVPPMLSTFMQMLLEGPGIPLSGQPQEKTKVPAAPRSLAQLALFNSVKQSSAHAAATVPRHIRNRETPLSIYMSIKTHISMRKNILWMLYIQMG